MPLQLFFLFLQYVFIGTALSKMALERYRLIVTLREQDGNERRIAASGKSISTRSIEVADCVGKGVSYSAIDPVTGKLIQGVVTRYELVDSLSPLQFHDE